MNPEIEARFMASLRRIRNAAPDLMTPFERKGLGVAQLAHLETVAEYPGSSLRDIASRLRLSPPTASVCVRKLEAAGYVKRQKDPKDARTQRHSPTEKGRRLLSEVRTFRVKKTKSLLSNLTEKEAELLVDLLERALGPS